MLAIPLICLPRTSNVCQDCQPDFRTAGKTGGTLVIPNATSLQDRTALLGIIFAEKGCEALFSFNAIFPDGMAVRVAMG